jgi:hypothetical protein
VKKEVSPLINVMASYGFESNYLNALLMGKKRR